MQLMNQMVRIGSVLFLLVVASGAHADATMTLGVSKSARLSDLLEYIVPIFQSAANLKVHIVPVEPGQEVAVAKQAEVDAMLFDAPPATDQIITNHYGVGGVDAFYDDFVIVGPSSDPAGIRGLTNASKAFGQIAAKQATFVNRADDRSANRIELQLWKSADIQPAKTTAWYHEIGQGGADTAQHGEAALNLAASQNAYTLIDRATWTVFKNKQGLEILCEGDKALTDAYSTILGNPEKRPLDKFTYARIWHDWLLSHHGREAFTSYKIDGTQIFFALPEVAH